MTYIDEPIENIKLLVVVALFAGLGAKYVVVLWPDFVRAVSPEYRGLLVGKVMGNVLEMGLLAIMVLGAWYWYQDTKKPLAEAE